MAPRDVPLAFVDDLDHPILAKDDYRHLTKSRRLVPGAPLTVGDGQGRWSHARLTESEEVELSSECFVTSKPHPAITIGFAPVKGDRPEQTIGHLTEIGVDHIHVLVTERSVVRWDLERSARQLRKWRLIARQACAQSRRLWFPDITGILGLAEFLTANPGSMLAEPSGPKSLFEAAQATNSLLSVAVGPEGGWSPAELGLAPSTVRLPGNILRAETAALVAATVCATTRAGTSANPNTLRG